MRVTRAQLNERVRLIRAGKAPKLSGNHSEETFWDQGFKGFGVRQTYTGQASWIVQYKMNGRSQKVTIGDVTKIDEYEKDEHGEEIGARARAKNLLSKVQLYRFDPQKAKEDARRAAKLTFAAAFVRFIAAKEERVKRHRIKVYRATLEGPYFQPLHNVPLDEINHEHIDPLLKKIERTYGPSSAYQRAGALNAFFNWAINKKKMLPLGSNPMAQVDMPEKPAKRERVLTDDEVRVIWHALDDWEANLRSQKNRHMNPENVRAIKLLFLTGCRSQEIGDLEWREIFWAEKMLKVPAERIKTERPLNLPLTDTAIEILKSIPQRPGWDWVFGAQPGEPGVKRFHITRKGGYFIGNKKVTLNKCIATANVTVPPPWRFHDIRRTVRTGLGKLGVRRDIARRITNHGAEDEMDEIYDQHDYQKEMREALERWEKHLLAVIRGADEKVVTKVLSDERRAILAVLHDAGRTMRETDIAAATKMKSANVHTLLTSMAKAGEIIKVGYGRYRIPRYLKLDGHQGWIRSGPDTSVPEPDNGPIMQHQSAGEEK